MELRSIDNTERDFPPEFCRYHDEGCEFASSCLNCPLPLCVYDEPGGRQRILKRRRAEEMARMYTTGGKGVKELAEIFKVSQRTVQRALKKAFSEAANREVTGHE
jgi:DNA-binding transcriptional ArsR family regulator